MSPFAFLPRSRSSTVGYQYDALGRRVSKTVGSSTTNFAMHGHQVLGEYTSTASETSPTETYIYSSYIDEPILKRGTGGDQYYHRNSQYSTVALTNTSGNVTERYSYDTYGSLTMHNASGSVISTSAYNNPYTFTGRSYEKETDNYYFRARWYDSDFGRFLSRDPLGYVDGMSQYGGYFAPGGLDPWGTQELGKDPGPPSVTLADPSDAGLVSELDPGERDFVLPQPGVPVVPKPPSQGSERDGSGPGDGGDAGGSEEDQWFVHPHNPNALVDRKKDFHVIMHPGDYVPSSPVTPEAPKSPLDDGPLSVGSLVWNHENKFDSDADSLKDWGKGTGHVGAINLIAGGKLLGNEKIVKEGYRQLKAENVKLVVSLVGGYYVVKILSRSKGLINWAVNKFFKKKYAKKNIEVSNVVKFDRKAAGQQAKNLRKQIAEDKAVLGDAKIDGSAHDVAAIEERIRQKEIAVRELERRIRIHDQVRRREGN